MRRQLRTIGGVALLALLGVANAYPDTMPADELGFLTRSCIAASASGADIVEAIANSAYNETLQPHHRNDLEQTKVFQATDKSFFLQNDPVAETCIIRSTVGAPTEMREAVKSMVAEWYGGTVPVYSGPNASNTAERDIYCVDPSAFGSGWFLIATIGKTGGPPTSTTILASAGRVSDSCEALKPKFGLSPD